MVCKPTFKQRIAICMYMRSCGHQTMVTETSKIINFWSHFVYNMVIAILDSNPIYGFIDKFFAAG